MALYKSTCETCREPVEFTLEQGWFHPRSDDGKCAPAVSENAEG
jgi:hypothetical protein